MRDISTADDIIDSRDVIKRIDELRDELAQWQDAIETATEALESAPDNSGEADQEGVENALDHAQCALREWEEAEGAELKALETLQEAAEGYTPDWRHGVTLIRDSYFEHYARDLADDIGEIDRNAGWPYTCIDWKQAAEELQMDYTSVDFDGITYWVR